MLAIVPSSPIATTHGTRETHVSRRRHSRDRTTDCHRGAGRIADRVEALGGRLEVASPEGGGTTLRATLPCLSE